MRRPINPLIPYPPEAVQHTRCVLALSMITVALSLLKPETLPQLGDLGRQVEKVDRWIERCADDTQKRISCDLALNDVCAGDRTDIRDFIYRAHLCTPKLHLAGFRRKHTKSEAKRS